MASVEQIQAAAATLMDFTSAEFDIATLEQIMTLSTNPTVQKSSVSDAASAFFSMCPLSNSASLLLMVGGSPEK
jgi:hypothetical protein